MRRYCGLCEEQLNYMDFVDINENFSPKALDKLWQNDKIMILCCFCLWKIADLFNEATLISFEDGLIRISYLNVRKHYIGQRFHSKIVKKKNLENILEMIFD